MLHSFTTSYQDQAIIAARNDSATVEKELERRIHAGDRQALLDLYSLLQAQIARCAARYMETYRHFLPSYIEPQDLVQEASLAMYQRLDEAATKDSPAAYLTATGYRSMRYTCVEAIQEPRMTSLDAPCFDDDETPLREYISSPEPTPLTPSPTQQHAPLFEAVERLPDDQHTVVMQRVGLGDQATHTLYEIALHLGKSVGSVARLEHRAYTALYFQLKDTYPHYAEHVLASKTAGHETWQRLDQAYTNLHTQGQPITGEILAYAAGVNEDDALAFLWEREGTQRLSSRQAARQRLDQAYAHLRHQHKKITVKALMSQAGTCREATSRYLKDRKGIRYPTPEQSHQNSLRRLEQAYCTLLSQGETITVESLARHAHAGKATASKYLKAVKQERAE
jgi:RNA polymerase sigma factor (sigma-70 family)